MDQTPTSKPAAKAGTLKRVLLALGALFLLAVLGLALAGWLYLRSTRRDVERLAGAQVARMNVALLCDNVAAFQAETGELLSAGPAPAQVPRGRAVPFPEDAAFARLDFHPGETPYQYQVEVREGALGDPEVLCTARGDLDGDGQVSVFRVTLDGNGMKSPVQAEREDE